MTKRKPSSDALYRTAEPQAGYFTAAQAARAGYSRKLLWYYEKVKRCLRVAQGIYRLAHFPASRLEDLYVTWLRCGPRSAISHESALAVYDLSDVLPSEIHVTVPRTASRRRPGLRLHTSRLRPADITRREGLPVTTVPRTIADVARAGLAQEHIARALQEALERGLTDRKSLLAEARRRGGRAAQIIRDFLAHADRPSE